MIWSGELFLLSELGHSQKNQLTCHQSIHTDLSKQPLKPEVDSFPIRADIPKQTRTCIIHVRGGLDLPRAENELHHLPHRYLTYGALKTGWSVRIHRGRIGSVFGVLCRQWKIRV